MMRLKWSIVTGNSLDTARRLFNSGLSARAVILGLPVLACILLAFMVFSGQEADSAIQVRDFRNAQLRTEVIRLSLERSLHGARNRLLLLSYGPIDSEKMRKRIKGLGATMSAYGELAFLSQSQEKSYWLVQHDGEFRQLPDRECQELIAAFRSSQGGQKTGNIVVRQPEEVYYNKSGQNEVMENTVFQVMRFSTEVQDGNGKALGILLLSLNLTALRDNLSIATAISRDSSSQAERDLAFFFDREGWMLFQAETDNDKTSKPLRIDDARSGFRGDYGRLGFGSAYKPDVRHRQYWKIVSEVKTAKSGHAFIDDTDEAWHSGQFQATAISYTPVTFSSGPGTENLVIGGTCLLDRSIEPEDIAFRTMTARAGSLFLALLLLGVVLWWIGSRTTASLRILASELAQRNAGLAVGEICLKPAQMDMQPLCTQINLLLEKLAEARRLQISNAAARTAQWQREPVPDLPMANDLPEYGLVGSSPIIQNLQEQMRKASQVLADVLIIGETGTGKELVSESIHRMSQHSSGPFISINCGALDEALLMDTLFGHVKGAFTEAKQARKGAFIAAENGTLMLDEVGNAAPRVQQALLRALSTRRIRPLGSDEEIPFNTRIIAATNAELRPDAQDNSFRSDLYYRLAVITINTPALRDRKEDIPALVVHFMAVYTSLHKNQGRSGMPQLSRGALEKLMAHDWPGNVRELRNTVTRALAFCDGSLLLAEHIQLDNGETLPEAVLPSLKRKADRARSQAPADGESVSGKQRKSEKPAGEYLPTNNMGRSEVDQGNPESLGIYDAGAGSGSGLPDAEFGIGQANAMPDARQNTQEEDGSGLNQRLRDFLPKFRELGSTSRQEYQAIHDVSQRTAQYDLQILVKAGLARREGRGPAQRYIFVDQATGHSSYENRGGE